MARRASVRYFPSKGGYFTEFRGVRHRLASGPDDFPNGVTYKAALEAFSKLMAGEERDTSKHTLATLTPLFLDWLSHRRKAATVAIRKKYLAPFVEKLGSVAVEKLIPADIDRACDEQRKVRAGKGKHKKAWGDSSVRFALQSLQALINWSAKQKLISGNPLKAVEQPQARSRGQDCVVSAADHTRLLEAASKSLRPLLVVLEAVGCRPGEMLSAEARHYRADIGAIVYSADERVGFTHKNSRTKRDRVLFLTGEARTVVEALVAEYPSGKLFRTKFRAAWAEDVFRRAIWTLGKKCKLTNFSAMSYRHTFATNWLMSGRSVALLAECLGTSVSMIARHYGHIAARPQELRKIVEEFRREQKGS